MDGNFGSVITHVALASALAWASGMRLYVTLLLVGLAGHFGWFGFQLPDGLKVLGNPYVIGAAGVMTFVEFFADKIPGLDSLWDSIHTFIRIPAGALLAAGMTGDDLSALTVAAGLIGGTITAGTHFTKAGSRAAINTSPEPVSNVAASLAGDAVVVGGLWTAINHPWVFLVLLAIFLALIAWLLPKLWRFIKRIINKLAGNGDPAPAPARIASQ